ncbi:MAG: L,D-transpeptidase family protein [Epsilonproteobacteria bacterium]|nr:L,D-transpeptidase family protein [Campylobacterota bacterium]
MSRNLTIKTLFFIFTILVFSGCEPDAPKDHYSLKECQEELLESTDYAEDGGIDRIVVIKKERKMYLYKNGKIEQTIPVSLGKNPLGQKEKKGDYKTPEGEFFIHRKLCSPKYYRSLCISYPRPEDKARAAAKGLNPGGDITIHAQPKWNADGKGDSYTLAHNWTQGCVAVTNSAMKELWYAVREGVPITIR